MRSRFGEVLPQDRPELCIVLSVPAADRATRGGTGCAGRKDGWKRAHGQLVRLVLNQLMGVRDCGRPFFLASGVDGAGRREGRESERTARQDLPILFISS